MPQHAGRHIHPNLVEIEVYFGNIFKCSSKLQGKAFWPIKNKKLHPERPNSKNWHHSFLLVFTIGKKILKNNVRTLMLWNHKCVQIIKVFSQNKPQNWQFESTTLFKSHERKTSCQSRALLCKTVKQQNFISPIKSQ